MKPKDDVRDRAERVLSSLLALKEDRGAMADLRRGRSLATEHYAWPWVARWCDLDKPRERIVTATVAAAFAAHPEHACAGNLGVTLRRIARGDTAGQDVEKALKSFEPRFRRLLTCGSREEVCQRLPGIVHVAAQRGFPIDYRQLFIDLWYWSDAVKRRWAARYWSGAEEGGGE